MLVRLIPFLALTCAMPAHSTPIAEIICAPRAQMVDRLTRQYRAEVQGSGLRDQDQMMEIWAAPSGDWTLVIAYATGQSCIVAMGQAWDMPAPADPA